MAGVASKRRMQAWGLLTPMLIVMLVITAWPMLKTIGLSFTDTTMGDDGAHWVGLQNYANALTSEDFRASLLRTLHFTGLSVGLELVLGVAVGVLLNQKFKGRGFARAILVLPWALPTVVNAMMWHLIYGPEYGALNALLLQWHVIDDYRSWLGNPEIAMNMVVIADVWKNYPFVALIVLAALQGIPEDLYEAARIDGANAWQRFRNVTMPGIIGSLSVAIVLRVIDAFKVFDIIYIMTKGGPADTTKPVSFVVYQEAFSYLHIGSGAAYAILMTALSAVLIALYIAFVKRQERT